MQHSSMGTNDSSFVYVTQPQHTETYRPRTEIPCEHISKLFFGSYVNFVAKDKGRAMRTSLAKWTGNY